VKTRKKNRRREKGHQGQSEGFRKTEEKVLHREKEFKRFRKKYREGNKRKKDHGPKTNLGKRQTRPAPVFKGKQSLKKKKNGEARSGREDCQTLEETQLSKNKKHTKKKTRRAKQ